MFRCSKCKSELTLVTLEETKGYYEINADTGKLTDYDTKDEVGKKRLFGVHCSRFECLNDETTRFKLSQDGKSIELKDAMDRIGE